MSDNLRIKDKNNGNTFWITGYRKSMNEYAVFGKATAGARSIKQEDLLKHFIREDGETLDLDSIHNELIVEKAQREQGN